MPPNSTEYRTNGSASPPYSRCSNVIRLIKVASMIAVAVYSASAASCAPEPADPPEPPRRVMSLAVANDVYRWGETITNPRRTATIPAALAAGEWPAFRGPNRDGRAVGVTFGTDWHAAPPKELWRRRVGIGRSSFAVVAGYAFTQEQRGPNELVICYEADTGEEVWINAIAERFNHIQGDGPRATPTFADGRLYTQGATGVLHCLDAVTGTVIWRRDVKRETGAAVPPFGFSSSPLVVDDLVIVFAGGPGGKGVAAFAADTGSLVWTAGKAKLTYSSPHRAQFGDSDQIIVISNFGVEALSPRNGNVLWDHAWPQVRFPRCVQPVFPNGNAVIVSTPVGVATRRLNVESSAQSWNAEEAWTKDGFAPYFNDAVYHEGYCFGFNRRRLTCFDAADGEEQWKGRPYGGQLLLLPDMDAVLLITERGKAIVFSATADGFDELASMQLLSDKTINHPVIAHGKLLVRNESEAVCYVLPE